MSLDVEEEIPPPAEAEFTGPRSTLSPARFSEPTRILLWAQLKENVCLPCAICFNMIHGLRAERERSK